MRDQDRTISPADRMTAAEWAAQAAERARRDGLFDALEARLAALQDDGLDRLASHLVRLDVNAQIDAAVDAAVSGHGVRIPASPDDFRRSVEADYLRSAR